MARVLVLVIAFSILATTTVASKSNAPKDFFSALRAGDEDHAKEMLDKDRALASASTSEGVGALQTAVKYNLPKVVLALLEKGARANAKDKSGLTALHVAVGECADCVDILLKHGASPDVFEAESGMTAVHMCALNGTINIMHRLFEAEADLHAKCDKGMNAIFYAMGNTEHAPEMIEYLAAHGLDVNHASNMGFAPLHWASLSYSPSIVIVLLGLGANSSAVFDGESALHFAIRNKEHAVAVTRLLVEHGADLDLQNAYMVTAFQQALILERDDVAAEILSLCAKDKCQGNVWTVRNLNMAAFYGLEQAVRMLLEHGVDVNSVSYTGKTALHAAANHGSDKVVKLLVDAGANVNARAADGITPLHVAAEHGHTNVALALMHHGANPVAKTDSYFFGFFGGNTPADVARSHGHSSLASLISDRQTNAHNGEGEL